MDRATTDAYLARIGVSRPERPDARYLRRLQERHLMTVPFENIDIRMAVPSRLGPGLIDKIVERHRGASCIEQASAFAELLRSLGYRSVTAYGGRICYDGELKDPIVHFALKVDLAESWLVDVGNLRGSRFPLLFDVREPQQDPEGEFVLVDADGGIDVWRNGERQYRLCLQPLSFTDFPSTWWAWTLPELVVSHVMLCSILDETGRTTLVDQHRLRRTEAGRTTERDIEDSDEVLRIYRDVFGIDLDELPRPAPGPTADDPVVLDQYRSWFRSQYGQPEFSRNLWTR